MQVQGVRGIMQENVDVMLANIDKTEVLDKTMTTERKDTTEVLDLVTMTKWMMMHPTTAIEVDTTEVLMVAMTLKTNMTEVLMTTMTFLLDTSEVLTTMVTLMIDTTEVLTGVTMTNGSEVCGP